MCGRSISVMSDLEYIRTLVNNSGPQPEQYEELNHWFQAVEERVKKKIIHKVWLYQILGLYLCID